MSFQFWQPKGEVPWLNKKSDFQAPSFRIDHVQQCECTDGDDASPSSGNPTTPPAGNDEETTAWPDEDKEDDEKKSWDDDAGIDDHHDRDLSEDLNQSGG